jgi:hypothetical protein
MRVAQSRCCEAKMTRRKLEQQARGRSTAARVVLRSRIVLLASEELQNKQIAADSEGCSSHGHALARTFSWSKASKVF